MQNDQIRRTFRARFSLSFGFGRTPRSIDEIAKKTSKKHKFRHGFHCLLASGGRPAHRAKVAFGAILTNENQKKHVGKIHKKWCSEPFSTMKTKKNTKKQRLPADLRQ